MVFTVLGMVAEMEVGFIRERQRAGIEVAKAEIKFGLLRSTTQRLSTFTRPIQPSTPFGYRGRRHTLIETNCLLLFQQLAHSVPNGTLGV
jgi:hypothetical protein